MLFYNYLPKHMQNTMEKNKLLFAMMHVLLYGVFID